MFRTATLTDYDRLIELGTEYKNSSQVLQKMRIDVEGIIHFSLTQPTSFIIVSEVDGVVEGFAICILTQYFLNKLYKELFIQCVYTTTKCKGDFLRVIEDAAKEVGADRISIGHRLEENVDKYHRLYKVKGFTPLTMEYTKELNV